MGQVTVEAFPWIDYAFSGEAELVFPDFCARLLEGGKGGPLPVGVISRTGGGQPSRATVLELDRSPMPDYDDYFAALAASPLRDSIDAGIMIETSRGCWWGEKHHCTFCGLNGEGMNYRSKSPQRVVGEFAALSGQYGVNRFEVVDNILDAKYPRTLLPMLNSEP